MKKLLYTALCLTILTGASCTKPDNYTGPSSDINGSTVDEGTGQTVQTEIGGGGTRIKLLETSYSSNPTPLYFQSMQDGTFNDNKIFAATYKASVEGPFVPLVVTDSTGTTVSDSSQSFVLKSTATLKFRVQPFLRIEWVGTPVFNKDSTVTVQFRITRGTKNPTYLTDVTDINLYVSNTQYDGNNNYDPRYSALNKFSDSSATVRAAVIGKTFTMTTTGGALPRQDVYFRIGARINAGLDEYNYNAPLSVKYP